MKTSIARTALFGPYSLDLRSGELRKFGNRIKMGEQSFRILCQLLDANGEMVTREELRDQLWASDTFVDFDHGLNSAVQRLRDCLSDTAEDPRWVATVPRRGYRFVGQVDWQDNNKIAPVVDSRPQPSESSRTAKPQTTANEEAGDGSISHRFVADLTNGNGAQSEFSVVAADLGPQLPVEVPEISTNRATRSRKAVALALLFIWRLLRGGGPTKQVMLAVLPFENLSGDPGQDYFSDGLTEEIITQLGALSPERLGVIARTTSMTYKHTSKSVQQIGQELGVDYVLESSVRRDGEQVRVTAQLIRARDQVHIWAQSYDRNITGSIVLQEEVARAVASQIEVKLSPVYANRTRRSHSDPLANEAYLRGQYFVNQFTAQGYWKAIDYFHQAIDRDPEFAEAYSGLADAYRWLIVTDTISPSEGGHKMNEAARQSVQLNNALAESHTALAGALVTFCDWRRAESEFQRANALNPSYPGSHRLYAALLASQKRHREALEEINHALRLDPLSLPINAEVVRTLYYARDYDRAIQQAQRAMQLDAAYYRIHFWLGRVYAQKGMHQQAIDESERVLKATPDSTLGLTELAYSLAAAGRTADARTILRSLEERSRSGWVPAYNLAIIHLALKENDEAFRYLQKAYDEQDWALLVLAVEPRLDPLRSDPRFLELCSKLRFPV
ncbi:MAG TPA: tetratricopeptide repeat protein [Candidatus Binatia bacterium]|nr:tetratricopeptide repeat protein [Candidatus Binatia bacterium]